jgi:hypothetical protein
MGQRKFREEVLAPSFNPVITRTSTAAIIKNRVVKLTAAANVAHTTGSSGRAVFGVALNAATGAGRPVAVQYFGMVSIHASTRAIARGAYLRASSGAASTSSQLGGTVRTTTVNNNIVGVALTSAAAAAGQRSVTVFLNPHLNTVALA